MIVMICPNEEMCRAALQLTSDPKYGEIEVVKGDLEQGLALARGAVKNHAEVVISRGGTYRLIAQANIGVPVVEIHTSPLDVLESLAIAMERNQPIAIVGYFNIVGNYDETLLKKIAKTDLITVNLTEGDDVAQVIRRCVRRGYRIFLGGAATKEVCDRMGYECHLLLSSSSALQAAMDEALRISTVFRRPATKGFNTRYTFESIVHKSEGIRHCIEVARKYSAYEAAILLEGESGVGKELFAQSIHHFGARKNGPFVAVNCAVLPKSLIESELFGYVEGAFTGSRKGGKAGYFELAHTGTIFLDEISELPLDMQGQLLRVVQEKQVMRLGDTKIRPVDARLISTTNKNLNEMMRKGLFRKDLFFRINTLFLSIPPLMRRREDVGVLAEFFLRKFCRTYRKHIQGFSPEALSYLESYPYEGNVRELSGLVERGVIICDTSAIELTDLEISETSDQWDALTLDAMEKRHIARIFAENSDSLTKTAKILGISRSTLWRKLR